jgi:hypothetical protein
MPLKRIGALWKPKPGGKAALSGVLSLLGEDLRVVVLKNEQKKTDRDPDYILHRALDDEPKKTGGARPPEREGEDL